MRANDRPALLIAAASRRTTKRLAAERRGVARGAAQLAQGQVVIGGMLAKLCDTGVGRTVRVEYGGRVRDLTVAAVVMDYHYGGLSLYIEREHARRELGVDGVNAFLVSLQAGQGSAALPAVRDLGRGGSWASIPSTNCAAGWTV